MKSRKLLRAADVLTVAVILCAAALFVIFGKGSNQKGATAQIRVNSQLYREIDLSEVNEPYDITVNGALTVTIHVEKGSISFTDSQCSDKICVNTGKLEHAGENAVCLPARVSVTVVESKAAVDEVSG